MCVCKQFEIKGVTSKTTYDDGQIKECKVNQYNEIFTKYGKLVPWYQEFGERQKDARSMSFYPNGNIKSIFLEKQTEVETPIGVFPTELITFFESGEVNSLFPLNGQIGFGWTEEDEKKLTKEFSFEFPFGEFSSRIIGLRFFKSGALQSLILWPGEVIELDTPAGRLPVRIGFRLYENGELESIEPAKPVELKTPIGEITAFDLYALGMDADFNSVRFDEDGSLNCVYTNSDIVALNKVNGQRDVIYQNMRLDMTSDDLIKVPVKLYFQDEKVTIDDGVEARSYKIADCTFLLLYDGSFIDKKCSPGSDCSDCGFACI